MISVLADMLGFMAVGTVVMILSLMCMLLARVLVCCVRQLLNWD